MLSPSQPSFCLQLSIFLIGQTHRSSCESFTEKTTVKLGCGPRRRTKFWRGSPEGVVFAMFISILMLIGRANDILKVQTGGMSLAGYLNLLTCEYLPKSHLFPALPPPPFLNTILLWYKGALFPGS